jgi:hypothetical protein
MVHFSSIINQVKMIKFLAIIALVVLVAHGGNLDSHTERKRKEHKEAAKYHRMKLDDDRRKMYHELKKAEHGNFHAFKKAEEDFHKMNKQQREAHEHHEKQLKYEREEHYRSMGWGEHTRREKEREHMKEMEYEHREHHNEMRRKHKHEFGHLAERFVFDMF